MAKEASHAQRRSENLAPRVRWVAGAIINLAGLCVLVTQWPLQGI